MAANNKNNSTCNNETSSAMGDPIPTIALDFINDNSTVAGDPLLNTEKRRAQLVQSIRQACLDTGFFYVSGHGVDPYPLLEQSKLLFQLPLEEKQRLSDPRMSRGYTGMGEETNNPEEQQKSGDTKEGFYVSLHDIPEDDPRYNIRQFMGPNQWPDAATCPSLNTTEQHFRTVVNDYLTAITSVARQIVQLLAASLDLETTYFDPYFTEPQALLGLLKYDGSMPSDISRGLYACGPHSDYGMITLLWTDATPGLEILQRRHDADVWIPIPPRPDCFVCNLGDMLERWTNGLYKSTQHRVILPPSIHERYSMPFFFEPNFSTVVECLPTCCLDEDSSNKDETTRQKCKYPPVVSGEYLVAKYQATHAEFAPPE